MVVSEVGISGNAHVPHCFPVPSVGKNKDVAVLGRGIRLQSFLKLKEKKNTWAFVAYADVQKYKLADHTSYPLYTYSLIAYCFYLEWLPFNFLYVRANF